MAPVTYTPKHLAEKIINSKAALEGERKHVTVLFADLKGSMELLADRDPEEARRILDPVLDLMMDAVHRYEGTVNQVMGDGIMALFGAPLAQEEHAVRACYAALRMQETLSHYAEGVRRTEGLVVRIRVGLNSGEVVVRSIGSDLHMDYTAVGQTTHLAARMEQLADPGSILLTPPTLALAQDVIHVRPLGPTAIKGLDDSLEVYELKGAAPSRSRFHARAARGLTTFVGRATELVQLRDALELARQSRGQVVAVVADPGVGKSRLFWEFTQSSNSDGCLVIEGASVSYAKATTYYPVIDLLRTYFDIENGAAAGTIRERVMDRLGALDSSLASSIPALLALLDVPVEDEQWARLDPRQRRERTIDAVKRLLLRESQIQPVVLVFEDLHWADNESQAVLDTVIEGLPTARLLLLLNYRPEFRHSWGHKTYYRQLRIDPLPAGGAEEVLHGLLGNDPALNRLKTILIARTEGNPFFLEESVRSLAETSVLVGDIGAYRLTQTPDSLRIPPTALAVLAARIDRLDVAEKQVLQAAAVIGKDVPFTLLDAITEATDASLSQSLSRLQAAEFFYETRLFPELEYTFKHALTQEAAYESLLRRTRQQYHRRIADTLTEKYPAVVQGQPERIAHHYTESGAYNQAVVYWERAGERALGRSAHLEAITHLRRGLEVIVALEPGRERVERELSLQIAYATALHASLGQAAPEVATAYERARQLCEDVGNVPQLFRTLLGLFRYYWGRMQRDVAAELLDRLVALAEQTQDPDLLLEAHVASGNLNLLGGDLTQAYLHHEEVIAQYSPERYRSHAVRFSLDPGVVALSRSSWTCWLRGYPDRALERSHQTLLLARELGHTNSLGMALCFAAMLHQFRLEPDGVHKVAQAAIELAAEHRLTQWAVTGRFLLGWAIAHSGQLDEGAREMRESFTEYQRIGAALDLQWYLGLLAHVSGATGHADAGLALVEQALSLDDKDMYIPELHRVKGDLLLLADREADAEQSFRRATEIARIRGAKSFELRAATSLARLLHGQRRDGETPLRAIYASFEEGFETPDLLNARTLLAHLDKRPGEQL